LGRLTVQDITNGAANAWDGLNAAIDNTLTATQQYVTTQAQNLVNDPVGFARAAGTVYLNTGTVVANTFTFGLIGPLNERAELLQQQHPYYRVVQIGAMVGREIAIQAGLAALTGGLGNAAAATAWGARAVCYVTTAQRILAPVQLAMNAYSFGAGAVDAYNRMQRGDRWGAAEQFARSAMQLPGLFSGLRQTARLFKVARQGPDAIRTYLTNCFAAGTPIQTEHGAKAIERLVPGDKVWARNEFNPDGEPELKVVEECFASFSELLSVHVHGEVIRTTREHPFVMVQPDLDFPVRGQFRKTTLL
jgi:hypothetical protein